MKKGIYKFLIIQKKNCDYIISAEIGINGIPFYIFDKTTYSGYTRKEAIQRFRQENSLQRLHMQTIEH